MSHSCPPFTTAPKGWLMRKLVDWTRYEDKDKWLKDMRMSMSLTVSIIATITFQSALNPPGGVVQTDLKEAPNCSTNKTLCPTVLGKAILAYAYPEFYRAFLVCNSICFGASLSVCFLLVSGLSLNHACITWLLLLCMWVAITGLALTYLFGAIMVTPYFGSIGPFAIIVITWTALFAVVMFILSIRFGVWGVNRIKCCNGSSATPTTNEATSISGA